MIRDLAVFTVGTLTGFAAAGIFVYCWWVSIALERPEP